MVHDAVHELVETADDPAGNEEHLCDVGPAYPVQLDPDDVRDSAERDQVGAVQEGSTDLNDAAALHLVGTGVHAGILAAVQFGRGEHAGDQERVV